MTRHTVSARLTPGESQIVVDGLDISSATTKAGTRIHFDAAGRPVLTVQAMTDTTIDLTAEDVEVRVQHARPLGALQVLASAGDGIHGDDAVTALDTFIARAAQHLMAEAHRCERCASPTQHLASILGVDAVRVAAVMAAHHG